MNDEELLEWLKLAGPKASLAADRIEALIAERDYALAQWDRAIGIADNIAALMEKMDTRRIEAEAKLAECEARLGKAVKLIDLAVELARWDLNPKLRDDMIDFTTDLKGESHE